MLFLRFVDLKDTSKNTLVMTCEAENQKQNSVEDFHKKKNHPPPTSKAMELSPTCNIPKNCTRKLKITFLPGNHVESDVIIDTRFTTFDAMMQQLCSSYSEQHPHLHVAFDLDYHVEVNEDVVNDNESWQKLIESTNDSQVIPVQVIVQIREKPNSSLEFINHEWDELQKKSTATLISGNGKLEGGAEELKDDWFDFIVDRVLDKSGVEESQQSQSTATV